MSKRKPSLSVKRSEHPITLCALPARGILPIVVFLAMSGCAAVPLEHGRSLKSYDGLTSNKGRMTKAEFKVSSANYAAAKTIFVEDTAVAEPVMQMVKKPSEATLVANVVSRALCFGVSDRFSVVQSRSEADIVVHATVTRIVPTNVAVAGLATVTSLGASALTPVPVPRIPFGLGGLSVEAEATSRDGKQVGAMVWSKGANMITSSPRISQVGDAYSLASSFGSDFAKMLVRGKSPFTGLPSVPSFQRIRSDLGARPKYAACERFGRSPGLKDFAASQIGLPPSWTDKAAY